MPLRPDGSPDLPAIAGSVRAAPGQVRTLAQLAIDASGARSALLLSRARLGEALAFESSRATPADAEAELPLPDAELPVQPALPGRAGLAAARRGVVRHLVGPGTRWRANGFFI